MGAPRAGREHLASLGAADPAALRTAAGFYEKRGQLGIALQMLLAAGEPEAAARLLAETDAWVVDKIDALELLSVFDRIPTRCSNVSRAGC